MAKYVWRVENDNGHGPYGSIRGLVGYHNSDRDKWPSVGDEGLPIGNEFLCGFQHKNQARNWFWGYWSDLRKQGFQLKRLRAKCVSYGVKQLTFKRTR